MQKPIVIFLIAILMAGCAADEAQLPAPAQPKEAQTAETGGTLQAETAPQSQSAPPTATPPAEPEEPVAPLVLRTAPEPGEEQPLDAPVEITFDQPMDRDSVERAFAIEPGAAVDGAFEWVDERTVRFALKDGFQRGQRYRLRIVETARSQAGLALPRPFELRFNAAGFLAVTNVQPADNAGEVLADTVVTVMFNRPVVPLGAISEAGSLPDPLTFVPPVTGAGQWLNTATYQFVPDGDGFQPATHYTARVSQGLSDALGQATLEDDFEWSFTTLSPAVAASIPATGDLYVSPTPVISVTFNQLMDRASVEQNLLLVDEASGQSVPGTFAWVEEGLKSPALAAEAYDPAYGESPEFDPAAAKPAGVETIMFTPTEPLALGGSYQIMVPKGVQSRQGVATQKEYTASFTVIPPLQLIRTSPADGERFADLWQNVEVVFNAPLNPDTVKVDETVLVESDAQIVDKNVVFSYLYNDDTVLGINLPLQENGTYTVTITGDIQDRYGRPLGQPATFGWSTLRQSPYVRLVSPEIASYNGYQNETYIYMTVRNVRQVNFALYRLALDDFLRLGQQSFRGWDQYDWDKFRPQAGDLIGQWQQPTSPETFINYVYKVDVSRAVTNGQPLPPGLYYLEAFAGREDFYPEVQEAEPGQYHDRQILIVSRHNLTIKRGEGDVLAWLTDLQTGRPVTGVPLTFVGPAGRQSGRTDAEGVARFNYEPSIENPNPALFVIAGQPGAPDETFAVGSNGWNAGIDPFDFEYLPNFAGAYYGRPYASFIYSARPLYRPGQTVYFKGILREDDDAHYSLPRAKTVQVVIHDAMYREIYNEALPLNEWGTFNGSLPLDEEASLGFYQLEMRYEDRRGYSAYAWSNFNVAEYRKPEFLVEATTDKSEYLAGETIKLTVETGFFFGGPVANASLRWTLLADPYNFEYQGSGYYDFTYEPDEQLTTFNPVYGYGFGEQIANGSGTTDAEGRFSLELPADLTGRLTSQTFTFDVAVTGLNNQEVATQVQALVHKGDFYVGLRPAEYVGQVGLPNRVEVLLVDWPQGRPVANQAVELVFAEHNWYSSQQLDPEASRYSPDDRFYWRNIIENVAVFTTTVTTDRQGQATASFTPDKAGNYKVYARAVDQAGHELFSSLYLWISGYQYVNWGQQDHDRIQLIADQEVYRRGDTATLLVPHPYSGTVTALITLERGHIYDHFVTELETNSDRIEIPITGEMSPNIYVSAMIMKGVSSSATAPGEGDLPGFKMGYARLNIDPGEKTLNISLAPTTPAGEGGYYLPGQEIEYQIKVTDYQGQPVKAELSLALIDKAVLALMPEKPGQLMAAFWQQRAMAIQTGSGLTLALDRINRALDEKKGGGGGDGGIGPDSVRQNFADTALWVADLVTGEDGLATVEATLPDNLTTWVLLAKGVTGADTLVGEARHEIVTSKPLLVRAVAPRFFVEGDEVELGMIVQNNTNQRLSFEPSFQAEGLAIQALAASGEARLDLEPGAELKLRYKASVGQAQEARLTMGAKSAEFGDTVAFALPIYRPSTPETVATVGVLDESGARLEGIALPRSFDPGQGNLTITIEPSLAAGMQAGLDYLEHFPYECVEQTVSRFLPNIFTLRAYRELGLDNPALAGRLPNLINIGLQRLNSQQHFDGGWGWWPQDSSDPLLTAYVLLGLVEARRADITVEDWVIQNAVEYLKQSLVAPKDMAEPWQANRQAFMLYALAEAGQADLSRSVALFDRREQLDQFGRAYLAMAIHIADDEAQQIDTLINDLTSQAVASASGAHWEEQQVDLYAMNTDTRSTAIIIAALARIQPDHPLLPQAVRWLMTNRSQAGHWSTTQETAWAIIGLTDWLVASGELQAGYAWQVSLNGRPLAAGAVNPANLEETTRLQLAVGELLADTVNRLAFERDLASGTGPDQAGRLYYGAYLTYFKPVHEVKAMDRGIIVSRQYRLLENPGLPSASQGEGQDGGFSGPGKGGPPITGAKVGDFIQVRLTLIAPADLRYVMVEDYLPAGTEALDSSLATTSLLGQGPQLVRSARDDRPWGWWYFSHTDLRDEKAVLFATYLPKGVYEYTYTIRAAIPGEYRVIPTQARQMYFPEVFGRSDGALFSVEE